MGCAHGSVNHIVDESENPHLEGYGMTIGRTSISSREEVEGNCIAIADTLEDLVAQLDLTDEARQNMLDSIARYNELCAKGVDEDFGKTPSRMFPIETPPFYATQIGAGAMLVLPGRPYGRPPRRCRSSTTTTSPSRACTPPATTWAAASCRTTRSPSAACRTPPH